MEEYIYTDKNGITKSVDEWAKESGINKYTIIYRINTGHTIDEAISKDYKATKKS